MPPENTFLLFATTSSLQNLQAIRNFWFSLEFGVRFSLEFWFSWWQCSLSPQPYSRDINKLPPLTFVMHLTNNTASQNVIVLKEKGNIYTTRHNWLLGITPRRISSAARLRASVRRIPLESTMKKVGHVERSSAPLEKKKGKEHDSGQKCAAKGLNEKKGAGGNAGKERQRCHRRRSPQCVRERGRRAVAQRQGSQAPPPCQRLLTRSRRTKRAT